MDIILEPLLVAELLALGAGTGFLAGLLGIGGGMVMVPFITALLSGYGFRPDLVVKVAIATSMATIIFTSISSVRAHHKRQAVRWDIVASMAPGVVAGGLLGSLGIFALVKGAVLALFFGVFVLFSALQMALDKKPAAKRQLPGPAGRFVAGGSIGLLSGLVGAGGGFLSVPFMVWCNVAMHITVGTSAALGFPIALTNGLGYVLGGQGVTGLPPLSLGYVWLPGLAVIATASVLTAPLGARMAHRLPVRKLKRIFALMLSALAVYMLWQGTNSL